MSISVFLTAYFWLFLGLMLGVMIWATARTILHGRAEYRDFGPVKDWLKSVLRRGYEGGLLRLGHEPSGQFMQFRKYIRRKGDYGLEIQCLGRDWSESVWRKALSIANDSGFPHRVAPLKATTGSRDGLIIDCRQDIAAAYELGCLLWTGIFGLTLKTPYKVLRCRWSELDELIDGPDHPPPLESLRAEERIKEFDARLVKLGGMSVANMMISSIFVFAVMISGIGFPIAILISRGQEPDWSFQLGTTIFGGTTASLVLVLAFAVSICTLRAIPSGPVKKAKIPGEKWVAWLARVFVLCLPFALFLVWIGH